MANMFALILAIATLLMCAYYIVTTHTGPNSFIAEHAAWRIEAPFLFRWLIPWTLSTTIPTHWLDATALRIALATLFVMVALRLMPDFLTRITATRLTPQSATRIQWMLLLMLLAHYILPRNLKFYYVYDLPSITFYLMAFLALTSPNPRTRWLGVLITGALGALRVCNRGGACSSTSHGDVAGSSTSIQFQLDGRRSVANHRQPGAHGHQTPPRHCLVVVWCGRHHLAAAQVAPVAAHDQGHARGLIAGVCVLLRGGQLCRASHVQRVAACLGCGPGFQGHIRFFNLAPPSSRVTRLAPSFQPFTALYAHATSMISPALPCAFEHLTSHGR